MNGKLSHLTDTDVRARELLITKYRGMSHREKLRQVVQLTQAVEALALRDVRRRHPQAGESELRLRLVSRWLDADLMRRLLDWDPDVEGL